MIAGLSLKLNNASFWDRVSDHQTMAQAFTSHHAERAWAEAALPAGAEVLDVAAGADDIARRYG